MTHAAQRGHFEAVVDQVAEPVRRYLHRRVEAHLADDVFAEVLVVLWRRLDAVPLSDEVAWAVGVARLQLANAERTRRRQRRLFHRVATLDPPQETSDDAPFDILGATRVSEPADAVSDPVGRDETADRLRDQVATVMGQLRAGDAEVLRLWSWEELAPREISLVLGISVNAATVRLHRARKRFATAWSKTHGIDGHEQVKEGSEQ